MISDPVFSKGCLVLVCVGIAVSCVASPLDSQGPVAVNSTSPTPLTMITQQPDSTPTPRLWQRDETIVYSIPEVKDGAWLDNYRITLSANEVGDRTDKQIALLLIERLWQQIVDTNSGLEQYQVLDYRIDAIQYETNGEVVVTTSIKPRDITKYILSTGERQGDWWVNNQGLYDIVKHGNWYKLFGPYSG